ncbi:MAG TPA: hypothetical protein PKJ95_07235 [Atribacterota bacterium]|jgi:hypothetical protein|nr:hypothetical protein [Atribacterota bacterium]
MHLTTPQFWIRFNNLPENVRNCSRKNVELLKENPYHPSLHFKKVKGFWSVRVGLNYRALAIEEEGNFRWIWIGSHKEYEQIIKSL